MISVASNINQGTYHRVSLNGCHCHYQYTSQEAIPASFFGGGGIGGWVGVGGCFMCNSMAGMSVFSSEILMNEDNDSDDR